VEQPPLPSKRPSARAVTLFLLLLLIIVFAFLRRGSVREREGARWGDLNRRAGDTYVHLGELTLGSGRSRREANHSLETALAYYRLSADADPNDVRTAMSEALVLQALGRNQEARDAAATTLGRSPREQDRARLRALLQGPLSLHPRLPDLDAARRAVGDLAPAPLVFSDAYEAAGQVPTAQRIWDDGLEQARRLRPTLAAVIVICGLILAAGLVALFSLLRSLLSRGRPAREPVPPPADWSGAQALLALLLLVAFQAGLGSLVAGLRVSREADFYLTVGVAILSGALAIGWMKLTGGPSADLGWRLRRPGRQLLLGLGVGGAVIPAAQFLAWATQTLFHLPPEQQALVPIFTAATDPPARVFLILSACVIIPAIEETVFRGFLYGALRRAFAPGTAALVSAAVFAGGHLTLSGFLGLALLGVVLAWLYERTGSLLAPMAAHGVFNGFGVALMLLIYR